MDEQTLIQKHNLKILKVTLEDLKHSGSTQSVNLRQECVQTQSSPAEPGNQTETVSQLGPSASTNNTRKRHKWTTEQYKEIVYCYYYCLTFPTDKSTTNAVFDLWKSRNQELATERRNVTPNSLANIRRDIFNNERLLPDVISDIERSVNATNTSPPTDDAPTLMAPSLVEVPLNNNDRVGENPAISDLADQITTKWEEVRFTSFEQRPPLPKLRDYIKMKKQIEAGNEALLKIISEQPPADLTDLNHLFYATATVLSKDKIKNTAAVNRRPNNIPVAQSRIEKQISTWRKELSWIHDISANGANNNANRRSAKLNRKYGLPLPQLSELLKQKITAKAQRIRRYQKRIRSFRQNQQFQSDTKKFYRDLGKTSHTVSEPPSMNQLESFWRPIWEKAKPFPTENIRWLDRYCESTAQVEVQEWSPVTSCEISNRLSLAANWKATGPDKLPNYWLKSLKVLHTQLAKHYNECINHPEQTPSWLTKGVTYMLPKSNETQNPKNYRPITCLTTMYKTLTSVCSDRLSAHLTMKNILPWEQRGCKKGSYGTKDQLLINKMVLADCKTRHKNLAMAWVDYKKAFDSLPHQWLIKCLEAQKVSPVLIHFLKESMSQWSTNLILHHDNGVLKTPDVNIRSGIFQGDSLSPLLFCMALAPLSNEIRRANLGYKLGTGAGSRNADHLLYMDDLKLYSKSEDDLEKLLSIVHTFSTDIGMSFGVDKCAKAVFKRGKYTSGRNITLAPEVTIKNLESEESYKYLGISEGDGIQQDQMKEKLTKEYTRRLKLVLKSDLNAVNKVRAINSLAIPVLNYSFGVIDWTKAELRKLDVKTRKYLTLFKIHHPKASVDRLYIKREEGGRGLKQIVECHQTALIGLVKYLECQPSDGLLRLALNLDNTRGARSLKKLARLAQSSVQMETENLDIQGIPPTLAAKQEKQSFRAKLYAARLQHQEEMPMYGQFRRNTNQPHVDTDLTWKWLKSAQLRGETEGLLMAAQDQCLPTNYYNSRITGLSNSSACRMCGQNDEYIDHIVSSCPVLAPTEYLHRHNKIGTYIHWNICKNYDIEGIDENWYDHEPQMVTNKENSVTILWDFPIQTDRTILANRPDIVVKDHQNKICHMIDVTVPIDKNICKKKVEKLSKYKDLEIEIHRMWGLKTIVTPVVVGALGTIQKGSSQLLAQLPCQNLRIEEIQKICLLGTTHILRKVLSMK